MNAFMGPEFQNESPEVEVPTRPTDFIHIFGQRPVDTHIIITPEAPFTPDRDATMLEAFLRTSIPSDTFSKLCTIIYLQYIAPQLSQAEVIPFSVPKSSRNRKAKQPKPPEAV